MLGEDFNNTIFNIQYLTKHLPKHTHSPYEVIFLLSGELRLFVEDRTYLLNQGSIIFINANTIHQNLSTDESKYKAVMIQFSKDFIQTHTDQSNNVNFFYSYYYKSRAINLTEQQSDEINELCLKIFNEFNSKPPEHEYFIYTLLVQILITLKRFIMIESGNAIIQHPDYIHKKISKIAGFINTHYKEKITLQEIAKKFNISKYYLSRNFNKVTGFSFSEFLNITRINMAKKILKETNLNITRVAEETGFNSLTHFGRMFKELVGQAPKQYRTNNN